MVDRDEPFLSRWSRLKREAAQPRTESPDADLAALDTSAAPSPAEEKKDTRPGAELNSETTNDPEQPALDLEKIDFDSLDGNSDYKPFMNANVPDEIRNKALAKLWLSDPVLSAPEQLCDYMEDFGDAAKAVPMGTLKTAYKVGQGFLSDEEAAEWGRLGRKEEPAPPPTAPIAIAPESPDQPEVATFLAASDAHAQSLYPPESKHLADLADLMAPNVQFFVARRDGKALGCGALTIAEDGSGELKRMWVAPEHRRHGVGRRLIEAIEVAAQEKSVGILRLEIGSRQPEAIAFFRRCGFADCDLFGDYRADPLSHFMEKRLA